MIKSVFEKDYRNLIMEAINHGEVKDNRTEVPTRSLFNKAMTIDLTKGFPILTGKKIYFDKALHEYKWMINGLTTTTYLHAHNIRWWDKFADANGDLGKTYGYQIRSFNGEVDQLAYIYHELRTDSRRAHITLWNPSELNETILPPCYTGFTFMKVGNKLNMTVQLRSSDMFLGLPYDICVVALILIDVAQFCDLKPNLLGLQITDGHLYENHLDQAYEYLGSKTHPLPVLHKTSNYLYELQNYKHEAFIEAPLNN